MSPGCPQDVASINVAFPGRTTHRQALASTTSAMLHLILVVALGLPLPGQPRRFQRAGQTVLGQESTLTTLKRNQVTDCTRECTPGCGGFEWDEPTKSCQLKPGGPSKAFVSNAKTGSTSFVWNATLAKITDSYTNQNLAAWVGSQKVWIGGRNTWNSSRFRWLDYDEMPGYAGSGGVGFSKWKSGEPKFTDDLAVCLDGGLWVTDERKSKYKGICQYIGPRVKTLANASHASPPTKDGCDVKDTQGGHWCLNDDVCVKKSSSWVEVNPMMQPWFQLDLGARYTVTSVLLLNSQWTNLAMGTVDVRVSNTNLLGNATQSEISAMALCRSVRETNWWRSLSVLHVPCSPVPVTGRYVLVQSVWGVSTALLVEEVAVFGSVP
ncbi:unnamed protein product [Darwinula stevensoni]|uniref:C-type lectin domain-containing protein n=1 Tax=Darwinula stevensoni TaxID=69355 RepID=A0A7R9AF84_9CRUS|nr:unnamed protein product [Darwinula stevensoni]CAG0902744.1 unnamed protein product [Darwinula stevensoni]